MSRTVTVHHWCDMDHERQTPATVERVVALDGEPPRRLDLCDGCDEDWILTLRAALYDKGVPLDGQEVAEPVTEQPDATLRCPECGKKSSSRSSLGAHARRIHNTGLKQWKKEGKLT